ncbi:MAG: ribonuclease R, partial [Alphaproteobacteria bacterium]
MAGKQREKKAAPPFPSESDILDYLSASDAKTTRRAVARAFKITGADRLRLKGMLREMADKGLIERGPAKALRPAGGLPKVAVLRVGEVTHDGTAYARAEAWAGEGEGPRIRIIEDKPRGRRRLPAIGVGERLLARLEGDGERWRGRVIKRLERRPSAVFGVFRADGAGGWV